MSAPEFKFLTYYRTSRDYSKLREEYCDRHVFECCVTLSSASLFFKRGVWIYIDHTGISDENLEGERISVPALCGRRDVGMMSRTVTIRDTNYFTPAYDSQFMNGSCFEKRLGILMPHLSYTELMDQMERLMLVYEL